MTIYEVDTLIILILEMKKQHKRLSDLPPHTSEWWSWDSDPQDLTPEPTLLSTMLPHLA